MACAAHSRVHSPSARALIVFAGWLELEARDADFEGLSKAFYEPVGLAIFPWVADGRASRIELRNVGRIESLSLDITPVN